MQISLHEISNFSKRLYEFMKECGFRNSHEFSNYLGYKYSEKINRLFRGPNNKPSYSILSDIAAKFPSLNLDWLITGKGNMFHAKVQLGAVSSFQQTDFEEDSDTDYIPLYDIIATAGSNIKFWESEENILGRIPKKFGMRDCDLAIHVYGNSMYPLYMPGDVTLLKEIKDHMLINYGQVYVVITEEHRFMKYVMRAKNPAHLLLRSENKHYDDIDLENEQVIKLYQVQGFFRKTGI